MTQTDVWNPFPLIIQSETVRAPWGLGSWHTIAGDGEEMARLRSLELQRENACPLVWQR
jgi:hypothetical protein